MLSLIESLKDLEAVCMDFLVIVFVARGLACEFVLLVCLFLLLS